MDPTAPAEPPSKEKTDVVAWISLVVGLVSLLVSGVLAIFSLVQSRSEFKLENRAVLAAVVDYSDATYGKRPFFRLWLKAKGMARVSKVFLVQQQELHTPGIDLERADILSGEASEHNDWFYTRRKKSRTCCVGRRRRHFHCDSGTRGLNDARDPLVRVTSATVLNVEDLPSVADGSVLDKPAATLPIAVLYEKHLANLLIVDEKVEILSLGLSPTRKNLEDDVIQQTKTYVDNVFKCFEGRSLVIKYESMGDNQWYFTEAFRFSQEDLDWARNTLAKALHARRQGATGVTKTAGSTSPSVGPDQQSPAEERRPRAAPINPTPPLLDTSHHVPSQDESSEGSTEQNDDKTRREHQVAESSSPSSPSPTTGDTSTSNPIELSSTSKSGSSPSKTKKRRNRAEKDD